MSVYLGFGIEITQVEYMFIVGFEYESVACGEQVMVEKNQRLPFFHQGEVIFQPVIYVFQGIVSRVVSVVDGGDSVMDITDIE